MKKVYILTEEDVENLKNIQTRILSQVDLGFEYIKSNGANLIRIQELAEEMGAILEEC